MAMALTRALFCGLLSQEKRMCLVVGFSDESATGDSFGPFLQAGYIAPETSWPFVADAWAERVLCREPVIPYLHMVEIRDGGWQAQHGLSQLHAEDKIEEASKVIGASGNLISVVSIIQRSDLEDIVKTACREKGVRPSTGVDLPDYLSFIAYAHHALKLVSKEFPAATALDLVVSWKQKVSHHLRAFYQAMRDSPGYPFAHLVGELIPASMELRNPLQAADALAWYQRRFVEKQIQDQTFERFRKPEKQRYIHEWTKADLQDFVEGLLNQALAATSNPTAL
jgi:hypothetical protein